MSITAEQFADRLASSGLMQPDEARKLLTNANGTTVAIDPHDWAKELVQARRLTMFQVSVLFQPKPARLVLGQYEILDKLGSGGMGDIYRAVARDTRKVVALKVLPSKALSHPESVQRFHREIRAFSKLTHPNIVNALDSGEEDDVRYLVMEYVEGGDLGKIIMASATRTNKASSTEMSSHPI
jgi:serine/threonine protein kinase